MTFVEIINNVLRRLREETVSTATETAYSQLIGDFVNETKREVEAAWNWTSLRTTKTVTTSQGTSSYALTGAGKTFRTLSVYNTTDEAFLHAAPSNERAKAAILRADQGQPHNYFYEGIDSNGDLQVKFVMVPDGVYAINFELVVPQADPTIGSEELTMDSWVLTLGAYSKAIAERGEDSGKTSGEAEARYRLSLSDSVAIDVAHTPDEVDWFV